MIAALQAKFIEIDYPLVAARVRFGAAITDFIGVEHLPAAQPLTSVIDASLYRQRAS
jgi:hypothetical protein